ncbi:MAG: aldehyde dehydrogenase family protein [Dermatophilus congolensis]|nr:aldehyde dehydrogenase family protein [Dermatophilus congolensis]
MAATHVTLRPDSTGSLDASWVEHLASFAVTSPYAPASEPIAPFTGEPLATLPMSTTDDVAVAYAGARAVQPGWAHQPPSARAETLLRFHDLVLENQVELLDLIQLETGKSRRAAFEELVDVCTAARFYARKAESALRTRRHFGAYPVFTQVLVSRRPVGVVGVLAPASAPLSAGFTDALTALVAGNAVVLRPHPATSLSALYAAELLQRAGCPPRMLQVVLGPGDSIGTAVVDGADHVCFAGTARVARWVAARAAGRLVHANVQVIGAGAAYVAADADVPRAAAGVVRALTSVGSLSCYVHRVFVHRSVADVFTQQLVDAVAQVRIGPALTYDPQMGSLASASQLSAVQSRIEHAVSSGATLLVGGHARPDLGPYFVEPTILAGGAGQAASAVAPAFQAKQGPVAADRPLRAPASSEYGFAEVPGPVAVVSPVGSSAEASRAIDAESGINTVYLWTRDRLEGSRIARRMNAGCVVLNGHDSSLSGGSAPTGGVRGAGLGRRHGVEGLLAYTDPQSVATWRGPWTPGATSERTDRDAGLITRSLRVMKAIGRP